MLTILVVDDEPAITDILSELLEDEGYRVLTAKDGREGLDRLGESPVDLIVTDVMMPQVDGVQMCRTMQSDPAYRHCRTTPVILMSAASEATVANACDYRAFINKPFDLDALLELIRRP